MNLVIQTIKKYIEDQNIRFVFPSQTAAGLWARKTCTLGIARSVAARRFIAWDRFKEEAVLENETKKKPVSQVLRKLFAEALVRKNAETPFLSSLIPAEHAREGRVFVPYIAKILPSLAYWEKLAGNAADGSRDREDRDYRVIIKEYRDFLLRHDFFEPSWEELQIKEEYRYVLFFPELIEDFSEYDDLLPAPRFIRIAASPAERPCYVYKSARQEIRSAVVEMQRLHEEEGFPYEDMAVSVPELEKMEPCLLREFSLRHIPLAFRSGKKLGESGSGRFFSLVSECAASRFSFTSLKALILNDHIPWSEREKNNDLIDFGIKYNCVSGYIQDGKSVDIWEEAFQEAYNDGGRELRPHYRELKSMVLGLTGAKSFADIRKYYFSFRGNVSEGTSSPQGLFNMADISEEDNAILSRCIEELTSLIELEKTLGDPGLIPRDPFAFFLSCLKDKDYVMDRQKPGVNIFKWRVAAASPFSCHFVLNASQSAAPVIYQPLRFLRTDKRKALGLEDTDATGAFFLLCDTGDEDAFRSRTRISASMQTFSGWAIPHSFFAQGNTLKAEPVCADPYGEERKFWRGIQNQDNTLGRIFPLQKKSYKLWKNALLQNEKSFSFFNSQVLNQAEDPVLRKVRELLLSAILGEDGCLTVTPTRDLNVYYHCPIFWLYTRIFKVEKYSLEAALLDDTSLGLLYHVILQKLFLKIKDEDREFTLSRLDTYRSWALEITRSAIKEHAAFRGPLAVPLVSPQASGMAKKIASLLEREAEYFDGYTVAELEHEVSYKTEKLIVKGIIDRISLSPSDEPVIFDYKTNYLPEQIAAEDIDKVPLSEFQMPVYIKLYEESSAAKVKGAYFYGINSRRIKAVMGEKHSGRAAVPKRDEYAPFLEAAEKQIKEFAQKVRDLDFVPREIKFAECLKCVYKTVCRTTSNIGE